jgi:hypothetical protein
VRRDDASAATLEGAVLMQDLRDATGRAVLEKGRVLLPPDTHTVFGVPWEELHVLVMEDGDVHEEEAGTRLARAAAGDGTLVGTPGGGHWPIRAQHRGILSIDVGTLNAINAHEGICVYTLYDGQVVDAEEIVARAKITPFVLAGARLALAEAAAGRAAGGTIRVRPFHSSTVGAVVQESLGARALGRFRDALGEKVAWFGSTLDEPVVVMPDESALTHAIEGVLTRGAEVITIAGTKAMDALDPAFGALERLGARVVRHGVPAHPGSLFWLARIGDVPVLGMPTCGLFSQATVFDLVLPRILAGLDVGREELAALGHGGFLTRDMAFRFPPYRAAAVRGAIEE